MATGRRLRRLAQLACLIGLISAQPSAAQVGCRLSLQLALDVSGSVDSAEYRLQLTGLANALRDPEVSEAILTMITVPVALSVYEWSGRNAQRVLADWQFMRSQADIERLATLLETTRRSDMPVSTGLGAAMLFASARQDTGPDCARHVLDISGDGKNNDGPRPQDVADRALDAATVNALVIGTPRPGAVGAQARETTDLVSYFQAYVLRGPESFLIVADGYEDYADAMKIKLIKELQVLTLSRSGF